MGRRLYVGNLPYKCTDEELTELFSRAGAVDNVRVMRDQATGRARGFAFVEMVSDDDAQKAISEFHQYQMEGRALVVNEARPPREQRLILLARGSRPNPSLRFRPGQLFKPGLSTTPLT
jgi:RNA recognition motif-containing protein